MDDAQEERFRQHEAVMTGLARMLEAQYAMNQRQDGINAQLTLAIERIDHAIERIDQTLAQGAITQARIETLLARIIERSANGRDA